MNKFKTNLFKIAKFRATYWVLLIIATILIVTFYLYIRNTTFH